MTPIVCISRSKPSEKMGHFMRHAYSYARCLAPAVYVSLTFGSWLACFRPVSYGCTQEVAIGKHERSVRVARGDSSGSFFALLLECYSFISFA